MIQVQTIATDPLVSPALVTSHYARDCARVTEALTDKGSLTRLWACYRTPGLHALAAYRLGRWARTLPWPVRWPVELLYQYLSHRVVVKWGIDLCRDATIGPGCAIFHQGGIVVGPVTLGASCSLSQGVTLGGSKDGYPTLGDSVFVGPGAKVFGPITIGDDVKIGANAVVHKDIPSHTTVALVPGYTVLTRAAGGLKD